MSEFLSKTKSVCPVCLKRIDAYRVVGDDGYIYMQKTCFDHGDFKALIWEDNLESYLAWADSPGEGTSPTNARKPDKGCPYDCGLCQNHEREGCCVLLELTNRCNLQCPVCFATAGEGEEKDLSLTEIEVQYDMLMKHGGPFNIQLSGGEPTLRDDLPEIITLGRRKGFSFFQLNTNGVRIAEEEGYAEFLRNAGVSCVFLQFDGFKYYTYKALRGKALLDVKLKAIEECAKAGLGIVLVPTVAPDVNEDEVGAVIDFAMSRHPAVRGVHFQPISYFGRYEIEGGNKITIPRMLKRIEEQTEGKLKAEDFSGGGAESPYCSFHASYRKTDDGTFKVLPKRQNQTCCDSSEARDFVARQWRGSAVSETSCCCSEEVSDCCTEDVTECCSSAAPEVIGTPDAEQSSCCCSNDSYEIDLFDEFIEKAIRDTFTVSGMVFQDASDLDLERLKRCYICEVDSERGMVPFCSYNLTNTQGETLYRK